MMREINTPLKRLNIHYYKDENDAYYRKFGEGHRKKIKKPFWKMKRLKLGIPLLIVIALGFAGYEMAMDYASEKVVKEISSQIPTSELQGLLKDPAIQKMIKDEVGIEKQQEILKKFAVDQTDTTSTNTNTNGQKAGNQTNPNKQATTTTNKPINPSVVQKPTKLVFKTRQEVLKFLLSKFTMEELRGFASQANGGLAGEEKAAIKQKVLSRVTPAEYDALKMFAVLEISKGNL